MLVGTQIGYLSSLTITDILSEIMRGWKGDASVLRPTIMASVPFILDRI
jgi:long-chain acyl-CoA synthetase